MKKKTSALKGLGFSVIYTMAFAMAGSQIFISSSCLANETRPAVPPLKLDNVGPASYGVGPKKSDSEKRKPQNVPTTPSSPRS